ncbi:MAG: TolC family protein [Gammaproteobacteria bacterium]
MNAAPRARRAALVVAATAVLLPGCGLQRYEARPLDPGAVLAARVARDLADPGLAAFAAQAGYPGAWPPPRWDLTSLTLAALYAHPGLAEQRTRLALAQAAQITAGRFPAPTIEIPYEHHGDVARDQQGATTIGARLGLTFEPPARRAARVAIAQYEAEAAQWDLRDRAWRLRSRLRQAVVERLRAGEAAALAGERAALAAQALAASARRAAAGEGSAFEESAIRMQVQRARLDALAAEAALADARGALAQTLGVVEEALGRTPVDLAPLPVPQALPDADELQARAMLGRADLRAGLARYAASDAGVRLAVARQYPEVTLSPGFLFDQGDNIWSLAGAFALPIANPNRGPIAEANARRDAAAAAFEALQYDVLSQLRAARSRLRASELAQAQAEALVAAADEHLVLRQRQAQAGLADRLDVLHASIEATAAREASCAARAQLQAAVGAIEDALQQPSDGAGFPQPEGIRETPR